MADFKKMFYESQAAISKAIEALETVSENLTECMRYCEYEVISEDDIKNENSGS